MKYALPQPKKQSAVKHFYRKCQLSGNSFGEMVYPKARDLRIVNCQFDNECLDFLRYYPNLTHLAIEESGPITDISGISNCLFLKEFCVFNTSLVTLVGLEYCSNLRIISLEKTNVCDLSPLDGSPVEEITVCEILSGGSVKVLPPNLPKLSNLSIDSGAIVDFPSYPRLKKLFYEPIHQKHADHVPLKHISHMPSLTVAHICSAGLENLEFLRGAPVKELYCRDNRITRLVPLPDLECLDCSGNLICTLRELSESEDLIYLSCSRNRLINLEGLEDAYELEDLSAGDNDIFDISALKNLPSLSCVELENNSIFHLPRCQFMSELSDIPGFADAHPVQQILSKSEICLAGNLIEDISNLSPEKLVVCDLKGNPLNKKSIKIVKKNPKVFPR